MMRKTKPYACILAATAFALTAAASPALGAYAEEQDPYPPYTCTAVGSGVSTAECTFGCLTSGWVEVVAEANGWTPGQELGVELLHMSIRIDEAAASCGNTGRAHCFTGWTSLWQPSVTCDAADHAGGDRDGLCSMSASSRFPVDIPYAFGTWSITCYSRDYSIDI